MTEEKVLYKAVLCFLVENGQVWLGRKMEKIGAGLWNGYGGGIETGETPEEAVCRELAEEGGVVVSALDLAKVAEVLFHNIKADGFEFACLVHVYLVPLWSGKLSPTKEMDTPSLFSLDALPYDQMMLADRDWLAPIVIGKKVRAEAWYGPHQATILRPTVVQIVDHF